MAPKVSGMFQEAANRPRGIEDFERVSLGFGVITGRPKKNGHFFLTQLPTAITRDRFVRLI